MASKLEEDKGIVYCNRVLLGNWYDASKLEEYKLNKFLEQMKKGDLMLARYRKMSENLNKPTVLTQSSGSISFGAKITLLAPHVPATDPPQEDKKGVLLGGRISYNEIYYSQELEDGCSAVGLSDLKPAEKTTFILKSVDYCNREGEPLKYNQEFLLALSSSVARGKALYLRYDPNPIPGLCVSFPLYLSKHPVSNTRWRALPTRGPNITRFEQEGKALNIAETGLGDLQSISDITTSDLEKNRYYGIAPYIHYRKKCFGESIETFDDLIQAMDPEKIILLKKLYKDVEDIDLLAGVWSERGRVPASVRCIVLDQLRRTLATDRHWYERDRRPHSFTIEQLLEIRKASVARLLCDVGDKVTEIQPRAFIVPGLGNEVSSCDNIKRVDYGSWKDTTC